MGLPEGWTTSDILELTMTRGTTSNRIIRAVNNHTSLHELKESQNPEFSALSQNELFEKDDHSIPHEIDKQFETCVKNNYKMITFWDDLYPKLLKEITHPPVVLFVLGEMQQPDAASISIVGTRRCTTYGRLSAERFSGYFARNNIVVCSGLAYGIDTIAHRSALKAGGITYAVIASGLDCISPSTSKQLSDKILEEGGAIISEYRCGVKARPGYFPQRNRIISGISTATLVVESKVKGGSLITAKFALDQERYVFAIPGNISSPTSMGCNNLLRQGAIPALSPEAVLEDLGFAPDKLYPDEKDKSDKIKSPLEKKIYNALNLEPVHIDELADKTGIDISELLILLLNLEFNDYIRQLPGKYYIRNE